MSHLLETVGHVNELLVLIFLELIWSFDLVRLGLSKVEMLRLLGECGLVPICLLQLSLPNNLRKISLG